VADQQRRERCKVNENESCLLAMTADKQQTWDLSPNDVKAIKWALSEIYRLRVDCDSMRDRLIELEEIGVDDHGDLYWRGSGNRFETNTEGNSDEC